MLLDKIKDPLVKNISWKEQEEQLDVLRKQPYDSNTQFVHVITLTCKVHNPVQTTAIFIGPQANAIVFYFLIGDNIY